MPVAERRRASCSGWMAEGLPAPTRGRARWARSCPAAAHQLGQTSALGELIDARPHRPRAATPLPHSAAGGFPLPTIKPYMPAQGRRAAHRAAIAAFQPARPRPKVESFLLEHGGVIEAEAVIQPAPTRRTGVPIIHSQQDRQTRVWFLTGVQRSANQTLCLQRGRHLHRWRWRGDTGEAAFRGENSGRALSGHQRCRHAIELTRAAGRPATGSRPPPGRRSSQRLIAAAGSRGSSQHAAAEQARLFCRSVARPRRPIRAGAVRSPRRCPSAQPGGAAASSRAAGPAWAAAWRPE